MRLKKSICFIVFLLLSVCCKKEYEYSTACIYETKFVHWGRGYYKLKIFYEFDYNDSTYKGDEETPGLYQIYGRKKFREDDSVFIKYPKGKPNKNELANYKVKRVKTNK
jgi:hypothetical protein